MTTENVWTIRGVDERGDVEVTTVLVEPNPEWSEDSHESEYRWLVFSVIDGRKDEVDGFDDLAEAIEHAAGLAEGARAEYTERARSIHEDRYQELVDVAGDWGAGPDRDAAEALAALIGSGRGAEALAALTALG